jgi:SAM-dependent methyltransferase
MPWVMLVAAVGGGVALLRALSRRESRPCPPWLTLLLENPYVNRVAGAARLIDRAAVRPGMAVLDAGCGPGRLTVPLARRVGSAGRVVALDIQPEMLARARANVAAAGLDNVEFVAAGLGDGRLPASAFDRAFLVTVLGEIPDKEAALRELHRALKPGGVLSVTEVLPDPHYQTQGMVRRAAEPAGFAPGPVWKSPVAFTWHLLKENGAH